MGDNARRRNGNGHARRALAARAQRTRAAQADLPKKKTDSGRRCRRSGALVRPRKWLLLAGLGAGGHQSRRRPGAAICSQTVCQSGAQEASRAASCCRIVTAVSTLPRSSRRSHRSRTRNCLSKAAQRMIADLRQQVQRHVGPPRRQLLRRQPHRRCWYRAS